MARHYFEDFKAGDVAEYGPRMAACLTRIFPAVAVLMLCSPAHAQGPARPLDGRTGVVSTPNSINRTPGTTVRVLRGTEVLRTLTTEIPIKLPRAVLQPDGTATRLTLSSTQSLVIDPDRGEWYAFVESKPGHSISVEGDNRLLVSAEGCAKAKERHVFLGSTYTRPGAITDREFGPKKEILLVADCVPYRAVLECDEGWAGCESEKRRFGNAYMSSLVKVSGLDIPEALAPRALFQGPAAKPIPAVRRLQGTLGEFRYHEPGLTLVRQYVAPAECGEIAKGKEFFIDRKTRYSRLVFAGPGLIKRFPIVLAADQNAIANSQIFAPGGAFFAQLDGGGKGKNFLRCAVRNDGTMGSFGNEQETDKRNFTMPWVDTFCEWRGNPYTQPFCAATGHRAMRGPHFGIDVRAWSPSLNHDVPIVSASDGVVVEVSRKRKPGGGQWEGFVVKVRSQHLIFVYRHLNPDKSPFREVAPNRLLLGDRVAAGQLIGSMGDFYGGPAGTTKHLHFEIEAPVPKSVLLGPGCRYPVGKNKTPVRVCTAREKAPPFPSLIVSYFAERYGYAVPLGRIDDLTGLPSLPTLDGHEMRADQARISQR